MFDEMKTLTFSYEQHMRQFKLGDVVTIDDDKKYVVEYVGISSIGILPATWYRRLYW